MRYSWPDGFALPLAVFSIGLVIQASNGARAADVPVTNSTSAPAVVASPITAPATLHYPRSTVPAAGKKISFKKTTIDSKFRAEGVTVGDFNHDGKLDIAAGRVYYSAPDWKMHLIAGMEPDYDPHGYSDAFMCYADDLNHDGWTDLIVIGFPGKETVWYENPQGKPEPWKRHLISPVSNNESPAYVDIDGSGQRSLVMGIAPDSAHSDGPDRQMAILRPDKDDPYKPWVAQAISTKAAPGTTKFSHGLGVGSIRGNGRNDVLCKEGWWESPGVKNQQTPWTFHPVNFGPNCSHMLVFDFNGDGRNDVLTASAHDFGIWWHEQTADGWKTHEIDKSYSETHSVVLADIAGDGLPGFVTGKRWWAHGPTGDPGAGDPAVLNWYELERKDGQAQFIRHEIDDHSGVGTQFEVADVNGDGLLDIVIGNKHGVFLFEQVRE
jgi:FG-GAP-like repeat/FG-GAP repeat